MNYGRLVFAVAVCGLAACAPQKQNDVVAGKASVASAKAVGTFRDQDFRGGPVEKVFLTINADSVTQTKICKIKGDKIQVDFTSPAQVSDSHFNVLNSGEKVQLIHDYPCKASLKAGTVAFEIKNDVELYITPENGSSKFFGYRVGKEYSRLQQMTSSLSALDDSLHANTGVSVVGAAKWYGNAWVSMANGTVEAVKHPIATLDAADQKMADIAKATPGAIVKGLDAADQAVTNAAKATPGVLGSMVHAVGEGLMKAQENGAM